MPVIIPFLAHAVEFIWGKVAENLKGNIIAQQFAAVGQALKSMEQLASFFAWVLERAVQGGINDRGAATNTISQIGGAISEHNLALHHIVDTIIPDSIHHSEGKSYNRDILPVKRTANQALKLAGTDSKEINTLKVWRKFTIDPLIPWLRTFETKTWPEWSPYIALVKSWLQDPKGFTDYFAAPMAGSLVNYWSDDQHQQTRDALTLIVVRAFDERPNDVETAIEQWLVTDG